MSVTSRILLAGILMTGFACRVDPLAVAGQEIPSTAVDETFGDAGVRHVAHDYASGFNSPSRSLIRDQQSWQTAWSVLYAGRLPVAPLPVVDFSRSTIVLVALGSHGTGGYDIAVTRVARDGATTYVQVTSTSPGPKCITTQAFTQPVDIVLLPHSVDRVDFVEKEDVFTCSQ